MIGSYLFDDLLLNHMQCYVPPRICLKAKSVEGIEAPDITFGALRVTNSVVKHRSFCRWTDTYLDKNDRYIHNVHHMERHYLHVLLGRLA